MKKIITFLVSITLFTAATTHAQEDTSMHATATAVCDCLTKADISDKSSAQEMQQAFITCLMSAPGFMSKIAASGQDYETAAQEIGTQLVLEMMKSNCAAFSKIAGALAAGGGNGFEMELPQQVQTVKTESAEGIVTKIEERDFTYITVKTTAGRELSFIYYTYVPGSDEWIKNAAIQLKNKNVSLTYAETEVYQPKIKQFINVKEIKTLSIK
jgi:hypothetical protein